MKKLSLGIQTFGDLILQDRVYVDKTRHVHQLVAGDGKYFFLSRPRRFGKSLLVSTLKELFQGNKEFFVASGKRIVLVGAGFDRDARNIGGYLVEEVRE